MLKKKCEEADLAGRGGRLGTKSPFSSSPLDLLQRGPAERQFTTGAITTDSSLVEGNLGVDHYRAFCFHAVHPQHLKTDISKTIVREKFPTSYSGSVALVASAFQPLRTSSSTGDLGSQTIIRSCLPF